MIAFACPKSGCDGRQQVGDEMAGQEVICLKCLEKVRVPGGVVAKPVAKAAPQLSVAKPVPKAAPRVATPRPVASLLPAAPVAPPAQGRRWFYDLNGSPCGPVSESDLAALAADDRIFPYTLVWTDAQIDWQPAGGVLPRLFKGATADDLRPPIGWWQPALGTGLVCVAMAAVFAAGLTYLLTSRG